MENKQKTQINMIPIDFTLFNPAIMEIKLHYYSCLDQQVLNNQTKTKKMIRIINDVFALKIVMMPSIFRIAAIAFLFIIPFIIYLNKDK